jgi:hypothetical protein
MYVGGVTDGSGGTSLDVWTASGAQAGAAAGPSGVSDSERSNGATPASPAVSSLAWSPAPAMLSLGGGGGEEVPRASVGPPTDESVESGAGV